MQVYQAYRNQTWALPITAFPGNIFKKKKKKTTAQFKTPFPRGLWNFLKIHIIELISANTAISHMRES